MTLLELLTVVAVIAVLGALFLPVLSRMRLAGQKATSVHNLRQLGVATFAFCADNDGRFPACRETVAGSGYLWWYGLEPFSSLSKPAGERWVEPGTGPLAPYLGDFMQDGSCPMLVNNAAFRPKYSNFKHNGYGYNELLGLHDGVTHNPVENRKRLAQLERPGEVAVFATTAQVYPFGKVGGRWQIEEFPYFDEKELSVHFRFGGKALVGFADGRVGELPADASTFDSRVPAEKIGRFAPVGSYRYLK